MKKKLLLGGAAALLLILLSAIILLVWASGAAEDKLAATYEVHAIDVPIPYPLSADERAAVVAEAGAEGEVDLDTVALARALERGEHLVRARYVCVECHGDDFSGGVMVGRSGDGALVGAEPHIR